MNPSHTLIDTRDAARAARLEPLTRLYVLDPEWTREGFFRLLRETVSPEEHAFARVVESASADGRYWIIGHWSLSAASACAASDFSEGYVTEVIVDLDTGEAWDPILDVRMGRDVSQDVP